tara:strand:- start:251 stop:3844 length:3594 start_codon:yes stop_codon:yes gene_type:complete
MDYKTIVENWKKFTEKPKPLTLSERRDIMSEVSKNVADKIYDWMAETNGLDYDFNEIFGDNMRVVIPLDGTDTRSFKAILRGIKASGWTPPISDSSRARHRSIYAYEKGQETGQVYNPDGEDWEPTKEEWKAWELSEAPERGFSTKKVKQKRQRLAADGGGDYEVEIDVADFTLEKTVEQVIPKGPRAGEKIIKVQKQGINKIIGGLEKKGEIPEGSAAWWAKNQTRYTKDNNHGKVEQGLGDNVSRSEDMHVILSRHPIDVLRMSDISSIHSCHSEGSEYFHCAKQEAKGHGPIAYAVTEAQLNKLLTPSEEREKPIQKMDRMFSDMVKGERITAIRQDYDTETPEGALVLLWVWARTNVGRKWMEEYKKKAEMAAKPERHQELMMISQARQLNIGPELFKQYIKNYEKYVARGTGSHPDNWKPWEEITSEEEYKAALEKHAKEATKAPDPKDIGDFDDEEIFTDRDRNIDGIGVQARVRLRKYVDDPNGLTFAAPESRTYGRGVPGFVAAVGEFVWEKQKGIFAQELGDTDPETGKGEATTYFIPQEDYLTRYGGSYGDTRDGEILNNFFKYGRSSELDDPFSDGMSVHHDAEGEEEEEHAALYEEYERAVDDLNEQANNELEHTSFGAHVSDDMEQPYVYADGSLTLKIPLGWGDDGKGNDVHPTYDIPENSWQNPDRDFRNLLDLPSEYPEEISWEHTDEGLEIEYRFTCEDCAAPDDADYFLDYMREMDGKYDRYHEIIRRKLVEAEYANSSAWDDTSDEIETLEAKLKNFNIIGDDDDDDPSGEIWFNLGVGSNNGDTDVPLNINLPSLKLYWLTKHSRWGAGYGARGRSIYASGGAADIIAKATAGRRERNVVWVGPGTNSSFNRFFSEKLKKLEAAANGYAEKQIDLPFGEKYAKPAYEGINFAKDTQIGLKFGDAEHRESAEVPIFLRFRVVVKSKDNLEELEGAFHFVEFIDNHMDMLLEAARGITQSFVIEPNVEIAAEIKEEYLSGDKQTRLSQEIMAEFTYETRTTDIMNHNKAIVAWWASGNTFSNMNEFEKEVLTEIYLRRMSAGQHVQWDQQKHLPVGWEKAVRTWMTEAGVAGPIINKTVERFESNEEITNEFFGTEEERNEKRVDYEMKLALSRYRAQHGGPPSTEMAAEWRQEIMNQLGMGLGDDLDGAMSERVAHLKKALTEAKIRANIRKVLRETE